MPSKLCTAGSSRPGTADAVGYAEQFTDNAIVVGFDGSEMHGRGEIARPA
jgi:hypothetical protein